MTVGELKAALEGHDDDVLVVVAKDAEGNGYSPLVLTEMYYYEATNTWSGEIIDTDEEVDDSAVPSVVLWPTN